MREKFGVEPALIPDYLALVGDAADGYPGIAGIGAVGAARLLNRHGPIESFPPDVLGERMEQALLFKRLATLRTDAPLFDDVDALRWRGPTAGLRRVDRARRSAAPARTLRRGGSGNADADLEQVARQRFLDRGGREARGLWQRRR